MIADAPVGTTRFPLFGPVWLLVLFRSWRMDGRRGWRFFRTVQCPTVWCDCTRSWTATRARRGFMNIAVPQVSTSLRHRLPPRPLNVPRPFYWFFRTPCIVWHPRVLHGTCKCSGDNYRACGGWSLCLFCPLRLRREPGMQEGEGGGGACRRRVPFHSSQVP